jgi:transposase-like protein
MTKRARRTLSPEFKLEAVRLVIEQGQPVSQVARELELRPEQLRHWRQRLRASGAVARPTTARLNLEEENRQLRRQLEVARQERDFAKSGGVLRERPARRYAMIAQYRAEYPLRLLCRVLAVSPAGFSAWQRRAPSARQQAATRLGVAVAAVHRQRIMDTLFCYPTVQRSPAKYIS